MADQIDTSAFDKIDEKGFVPDDARNTFFRKLRMKNENRSCFECTARNPTWISLSYGVYLCLECSGEHRRKGVHISFVRSVELDSFTSEQMVQMAVGGNGKAWTYFKQHGMGKTSEAGRHLDYNSKIAARYKEMIEKDTKDTCAKLGVGKESRSAAVAVELDPVDQAAELAGPPSPSGEWASTMLGTSSSTAKAEAPAPARVTVAKSSPSVAKTPTSVVIRRSEPVASATAAAPTSAPAKPSFTGGAKQMAKQIEFDFDFDELEEEAKKPAPAQAPKPAAAPPKPIAAPAVEAPSRTIAGTPAATGSSEVASKFSTKKGISSDDFFHDETQESATARMEREARYNKFADSGAISSSSFFNSGDPNEQGGDDADWKAVASQGANIARTGISKGAELITTYLNKVRD